MKAFLLTLTFGAFSLLAKAQSPVDEYIKTALNSNLVLKQKNIELTKAQVSLKQAKSLFLPKVDLVTDYTFGTGGRRIDIPIGDLLNNVYSTLNQLTQSSSFPQVENVNEELNPYDFYDARIKATMPLYNRQIIRNKNITKKQQALSEKDVFIYKRDLVRDIKVAYFNYLKTKKEIDIYENAIVLLEKNKQVNASLLKNGSGLKADLLRVQSELENTKARLQSAKNKSKNAAAYFNFLINQPLDSPILIEEKEAGLFNTDEVNVDKREELEALNDAIEISEEVVKMNQEYIVPRLGAFLDVGSQGFDFQLDDESAYVFGGINLTIPLFEGNNNRHKIQQAKLDKEFRTLERDNVKQQLELSAAIAVNELKSATQNYLAAQKRLTASESYYTLLERGYKEGSNSQIEFIDAQNQLNSAKQQLNISLYDIHVKRAELERQNASYQF